MQNRHLLSRLAVGLLAIAVTSQASARDPFELTIMVDSDTAMIGFNNFEDAIEQLEQQNINGLQGINYRPHMSSVNVAMDFRGLPTTLAFPEDSAQLTFSFLGFMEIVEDPGGPEDQVDQRRTDALRILIDRLKDKPDLLKRLQTALAQFSPIDPLAGNPGSLMSQMMQGDFDYGFTHKVSQVWGCGTSAFNLHSDEPIMIAVVGGVSDIFADAQSRAADLQAQNEFGIGLGWQSINAPTTSGDFQSTTFTVPFSYTAKMDFNPSHKLRFDLPFTYTDTEGAESWSGGLGLAYTYPVMDVWTLTPAVGVGATGSADLGAAGGVSAYSLTSAYTWRLGGFALSMGNSVGQYDTIDLEFGDVSAGAEISNTVFTNGLLLTGPNSLIAKNLVMEYSFQDTRITGDTVYSEFYDEFGVALGYINTEAGVIDSYYKAGLSYLVGEHDIEAIKLNLAVRF